MKSASVLSLAVLQFAWLNVHLWLRRVIKWILRKTTGLCELQRIAYGEAPGAARSSKIENCLMVSRQPEIRKLLGFLDRASRENRLSDVTSEKIISNAVQAVMEVKYIKPSIHSQFISSFGLCVRQIWCYRQLLYQLEGLRTTLYDSDNREHEEKLLTLWHLLRPDEKLSGRVSRQWQDIGFQGDDPKTDFRGMGMLGLENLLYFVMEYPEAARHVLSHSNHPRLGYSFAIVGINLTSMSLNLFREGTVKYHVFNACQSGATFETFHKFYCYVYLEFDKFWFSEKPRDLMEFGRIKDKFEVKLKKDLSDINVHLKLNVAVETI